MRPHVAESGTPTLESSAGLSLHLIPGNRCITSTGFEMSFAQQSNPWDTAELYEFSLREQHGAGQEEHC